MNKFDKLKSTLGKHPEVQAATPQQRAVLATARMVYNWRKVAGLSQIELAKSIGKKQESISRIERGTSPEGPKLSTLAAIAAACGQQLILGGAPVADDAAKAAATAWTVLTDAPIPATLSEAPILNLGDLGIGGEFREWDIVEKDAFEPVIFAAYHEQSDTAVPGRVDELLSERNADIVRRQAGTFSFDQLADALSSTPTGDKKDLASHRFYTCHLQTAAVPSTLESRVGSKRTRSKVRIDLTVMAPSKGTAAAVADLIVKGSGKTAVILRDASGQLITKSRPHRRVVPGTEKHRG